MAVSQRWLKVPEKKELRYKNMMARDSKRQGRGGRRREKREFDQKTVDLARVARVVAGGRRFRFRATVVIGDRKGRVGMGIAKGKDVSNAIDKAVSQAKRNLIEVPLTGGTIPHEVRTQFGGADVLIKPARPGTGIIAGGAIRPVMELAGVKDIVSKMLGSSNHTNNVQATLQALSLMETPEQLSVRRGLEVKGTFQRSAAKESAQKKTDKEEVSA